MVSKTILNAAPDNDLIRNTMKKADLLLNSYKNPVCSVSGGSDSDVMLDLLERYYEEVCCNGDSEHRADFRLEDETCEKWEGNDG